MTGNELKDWRESFGISQQALAIQLNNMSVSTIARWEQLKDQEVPNNLLELALKSVEPKDIQIDARFKNANADIEFIALRLDELSTQINTKASNGWGYRAIEKNELLTHIKELFEINQTLVFLVIEHQDRLPNKTIAYNFPLRSYVGGISSLLALVSMDKGHSLNKEA